MERIIKSEVFKGICTLTEQEAFDAFGSLVDEILELNHRAKGLANRGEILLRNKIDLLFLMQTQYKKKLPRLCAFYLTRLNKAD